MENTSIKYVWLDEFDGGEQSAYFDTIEDAKADMIYHIRNIRWTKAEMLKYQKNNEDYVNIYKVTLDEDGEEKEFEQTAYGERINETTVDRVY